MSAPSLLSRAYREGVGYRFRRATPTDWHHDKHIGDSTESDDRARQAVFAQQDTGLGATLQSACLLKAMDTGTSTAIAHGNATVSYNKWYRIGAVPKSMAPGQYLLQCNMGPDLQLGIADNPNFGAGILKGVLAAIIPFLRFIAALILVVVVAVKRSRAIKRANLRFFS